MAMKKMKKKNRKKNNNNISNSSDAYWNAISNEQLSNHDRLVAARKYLASFGVRVKMLDEFVMDVSKEEAEREGQQQETTTVLRSLSCNWQTDPVIVLDGTITSQDIASGTIPSGSTPADNSVTTAKIADGEVKSVDIGNDEVFSVDIVNGQVGSADIQADAVTTDKISDTNGVHSVDIVNGQVGSADIGDGQVTAADIADNAIQPNIQRIQGNTVTIPANQLSFSMADCPPGTLVTGGGFSSQAGMEVVHNTARDGDTWEVGGFNAGIGDRSLTAFAVCIGRMP
jgi:hypothetical protein